MKKLFFTFICFSLCSHLLLAKGTRLKEIIEIKGVRENPIIGYGLVIGLNGTGDGGNEILNSSMTTMFKKMGLNPQQEITSKNVASVVVTAKLPAFARIGQKVDITVSSVSNASSLAGGTLLVTPLKGGDGQVYAVASGPLSIGGLKKGLAFPTTGLISSGATVEKEIAHDFYNKKSLRISLKDPDFTTSARVEKVINQELGGKYATSKDSATIDLIIPVHYERNIVQLLALVENFTVHTDIKAKIVINERTGTVVAGGNITLKPVAISHGDLTIEITDPDQKTQKGNGPKANHLYYIEKRTTLNDLVKSLNAFGATSEDLISIFQALRKNGSLIGDIEMI